jgi:hypothetical protein
MIVVAAPDATSRRGRPAQPVFRMHHLGDPEDS